MKEKRSNIKLYERTMKIHNLKHCCILWYLNMLPVSQFSLPSFYCYFYRRNKNSSASKVVIKSHFHLFIHYYSCQCFDAFTSFFISSSFHVEVDFTHSLFYYLITKPDAHKKGKEKQLGKTY